MKTIAVAANGDQVNPHFGQSPSFAVYEVDGDRVVSRQTVDSPGHSHAMIPRFLRGLGADVVISGGMGQGAQRIFERTNIDVITGASGAVDDVVDAYLHGRLETDGQVCQEHGDGAHGHGGHGHGHR